MFLKGKNKQELEQERLQQLAEEIRNKRNQLLAESDWTQLPDAPVKDKEAWQEYRQALRNLTKQPGFPENIEFPEEPDRKV